MVLVAIAVVPAIALFTGFRWADGQVVDDTAAPVPSSTVVAPPAAYPPLTTGMLSTRRFPTIASRSVNVEVFEADVVPFYPSVNDRSCVAMSVDGIDVGSKNEAIPVIPASNQKIVVAAVAIDELGSEAQRARWLPDVAAGRCVATVAITEELGSDEPAALGVAARRDGDGWCLEGSKLFVPDAGAADLFVVDVLSGNPEGHHVSGRLFEYLQHLCSYVFLPLCRSVELISPTRTRAAQATEP